MDRWIMGYYGASFESLSVRKHGQGNNAAIFYTSMLCVRS